MARTKITLNHGHDGVQALLDGGQGVDALLQKIAEEKVARAKGSAPVESGAYRDSIHVETLRTDRMVKRVVADVSYAADVEANTGNLGRSL